MDQERDFGMRHGGGNRTKENKVANITDELKGVLEIELKQQGPDGVELGGDNGMEPEAGSNLDAKRMVDIADEIPPLVQPKDLSITK